MAKHNKHPCTNCPYRKDAPVGLWHAVEFKKVVASEAQQMGSLFHCHKHSGRAPAKRSLCVGFVLDQVNRGMPNLSLRMAVISDADVAKVVSSASSVVPMYSSALEMCAANGVDNA